MNYIKVEVISANEVDDYLAKGWVIIEVTKAVDIDQSTYLKYHVGYPIQSQTECLLEIIKQYEKYGLKKVLIERKAEELGEDIQKYDTSGFQEIKTELTEFLSKYEFNVNNKVQKYYNDPEVDFDF